jgi:NADPH:quinone reductase-like Zn-dependent oxidoreductase
MRLPQTEVGQTESRWNRTVSIFWSPTFSPARSTAWIWLARPSLKTLKKGGRLVSIKGQDADGLAERYGVHFETLWMSPNGEMLAELGALIANGIVVPVIDSTFPMDQTDAAYEQLASGHAVGKIVVTVA